MSTPVRADSGTRDYVIEVMREYHPRLDEAGVTVEVRWQIAGDGEEHAIKVKGYPALATIAITPLKYRCLNVADAQIDIDRAKWVDMDDDRRKALIDHELYHLELVEDEETGEVKRDDADRPKLRIRPHDWEIGGFDAIAQRHQEHAAEVLGLKAAFERTTQTTFPWG